MCARAETVERKGLVFYAMGTNVAKQMTISREQVKNAFRRQRHPARVLAATEEVTNRDQGRQWAAATGPSRNIWIRAYVSNAAEINYLK